MSSSPNFRPRARIIKTLGSELISSSKVALVELVKNSYDADAHKCLIRYVEPSAQQEGEIYVVDNGHGMSMDELASGWLELATASKVHRRCSEQLERPLLGEKGVGRLAAAKLGGRLVVLTQRENHAMAELGINWEEFDEPDKYLDEIDVNVQECDGDINSNLIEFDLTSITEESPLKSSGTILRITGGVPTWSDSDLQDIIASLQRLLAPSLLESPASENSNDFELTFEIIGKRHHLSGVIGPPDFLMEPLYSLTAFVDETGTARISIGGTHPDLKPQERLESIWSGQAPPVCGAFVADFKVWDRDSVGLEHTHTDFRLGEFRRQLDAVCGMSVYRDGFRLFPFGERGDDWLGLDRRRVNQPSLRVSNNQLVGSVRITASENPGLQDQSNREGLIEGQAYDDFRELALSLLALLEASRRAARRPKREDGQHKTRMRDNFDLSSIRKIAQEESSGDRVIKAISEKQDQIDKALDDVQGQLVKFSIQATLGQLIDRVVHDGRNSLGPIDNKMDIARSFIPPSESYPVESMEFALNEMMETVTVQTDNLGFLFRLLDPLSIRRRGRPRNVEALETLKKAKETADFTLCPSADIQIIGDNLIVRWAEDEIISAVMNLLNNSLYWLARGQVRNPLIIVEFRQIREGLVRIRVSDNGPGVDPVDAESIFDFEFTRKHDGSGMGLSIVGYIASNYGGELLLQPVGIIGGATFDMTIAKGV